MKNLTITLVIGFAFLFTLTVSAQNEIALVDNPDKTDRISTYNHETIKLNKSAFGELTEYIQKNVRFPFGELNGANSVLVTLQVSVNELGEIIDARIAQNNHEQINKEVLRVVNNKKNLSPFTYNGVPKSQTFQIGIRFNN